MGSCVRYCWQRGKEVPGFLTEGIRKETKSANWDAVLPGQLMLQSDVLHINVNEAVIFHGGSRENAFPRLLESLCHFVGELNLFE
jgi:hypothetical protein